MNVMAMRWSKLYEGTKAEVALEDAVASLGVPYRTQFPGYRYGCRFFPDFYLPTLKLVIEVDDKSHDHKTAEDDERTRTLQAVWGVQVVRCTNAEALTDPYGTVDRLLQLAKLWPLPEVLPTLVQSMPPLRKASKKSKRDQATAAVKAKRDALAKPRSV